VSRTLIVAPQALRQIEALDGWWRENREKAPNLFREELAAAFETITEAPALGRRFEKMSGHDVRRVLMRSTRTHVYYVFDDARVSVVAVWGAIKGRGPDLSEL